jgi:hypothetical protein
MRFKSLILFVAAMGLFCLMVSSAFAEDAISPSAGLAKGSQERKAILDALRKALSPLISDRIVFVVKHLKVKNGWAWVETYPQSPDGTAKYEPVDALLHKEGNEWVVKAMRPCCGEYADDPDCVDIKRYYRKLMREFPSVPAGIFP